MELWKVNAQRGMTFFIAEYHSNQRFSKTFFSKTFWVKEATLFHNFCFHSVRLVKFLLNVKAFYYIRTEFEKTSIINVLFW